MPVTDHPAIRRAARRLPDDPAVAAARVLRAAEADAARLAGHLLARGRESAVDALAGAMSADRAYAAAVVDAIAAQAPPLTGAETVAVVLAAAGTTTVFGYPGTSELALCDALDRTAGVEMVNGRGDKESAFLAAGACLLEPGRGAAVLHGARGLTNATGAIADALRNEIGTLCVAGLPTTASAPFLPPHGEAGLLPAVGAFTGWWWQAPAVPDGAEAAAVAASEFVARVREACRRVREAPHRPVLLGVPQDVAEARWVPAAALLPAPAPPATRRAGSAALAAAADALRAARRPVLLVDDYALRFDVRPGLDLIGRVLGAAVLQVRYRRGPMLFERLRFEEVTGFAGWLNPYSHAHAELLAGCDLLVTVEDRNMYPRVTGPLPACPKVVIGTDPAKAAKNGYLRPGDLVVAGDPGVALREVAGLLERDAPRREPWFGPEVAKGAEVGPEPPPDRIVRARGEVAAAVAGLLARWEHPVLVDDSQMFGGLLAESYDAFPAGLRVFGGHGGFVGAGLPLATGLALAEPARRVLCTLGDQAFTNSFQGLVAAVQQRARVTYLVCNNGRSVSLAKQAAAGGPEWFDRGRRPLLRNAEGLDYCAVARALGVPAASVGVPVGAAPAEVSAAVGALAKELEAAAGADGPALVELRLPDDPVAWRGIWVTRGFDEQRAVAS